MRSTWILRTLVTSNTLTQYIEILGTVLDRDNTIKWSEVRCNGFVFRQITTYILISKVRSYVFVSKKAFLCIPKPKPHRLWYKSIVRLSRRRHHKFTKQIKIWKANKTQRSGSQAFSHQTSQLSNSFVPRNEITHSLSNEAILRKTMHF